MTMPKETLEPSQQPRLALGSHLSVTGREVRRQTSSAFSSPGKLALLILLFLLSGAGLISLANGVRRGLACGQDFQWSGARLLMLGMDPWQVFLRGDPHHLIALHQAPNYLPELYLLLLPFGALRLDQALIVWSCVNLIFLLLSVLLVSRIYQLSSYASFALAALMALSAPTRACFVNGQQSLFVLFCIIVAFTVSSDPIRGTLLGLSFAKYSFAPVILGIALLRRRVRLLLFIMMPITIGFIFAWNRTGTRLIILAIEPLRCALLSVAPGYADLVTILQMVLVRCVWTSSHAGAIATGGGFSCAIFMAWLLEKSTFSPKLVLVLTSIITLLCFKHLIHDYVFLIFPLAAFLDVQQFRFSMNDLKIQPVALAVYWGGWVAVLYLLLLGGAVGTFHLLGDLPLSIINGLALLMTGVALACNTSPTTRPSITGL